MEQEQADRIEAKLDYIIAKIQYVEDLAATMGPMVANHPLLRGLLK